MAGANVCTSVSISIMGCTAFRFPGTWWQEKTWACAHVSAGPMGTGGCLATYRTRKVYLITGSISGPRTARKGPSDGSCPPGLQQVLTADDLQLAVRDQGRQRGIRGQRRHRRLDVVLDHGVEELVGGRARGHGRVHHREDGRHDRREVAREL